MGLLDSIVGALSSGDDGGCDWICDSCGAYMNDQPRFNVSSGSWCCKECGSWNDVNMLEAISTTSTKKNETKKKKRIFAN